MNKAQGITNVTVTLDGIPHFLAPDHADTMTLWRGEPGDPFPVAIEDEHTCDPFIWMIVEDRFMMEVK